MTEGTTIRATCFRSIYVIPDVSFITCIYISTWSNHCSNIRWPSHDYIYLETSLRYRKTRHVKNSKYDLVTKIESNTFQRRLQQAASTQLDRPQLSRTLPILTSIHPSRPVVRPNGQSQASGSGSNGPHPHHVRPRPRSVSRSSSSPSPPPRPQSPRTSREKRKSFNAVPSNLAPFRGRTLSEGVYPAGSGGVQVDVGVPTGYGYGYGASTSARSAMEYSEAEEEENRFVGFRGNETETETEKRLLRSSLKLGEGGRDLTPIPPMERK